MKLPIMIAMTFTTLVVATPIRQQAVFTVSSGITISGMTCEGTTCTLDLSSRTLNNVSSICNTNKISSVVSVDVDGVNVGPDFFNGCTGEFKVTGKPIFGDKIQGLFEGSGFTGADSPDLSTWDLTTVKQAEDIFTGTLFDGDISMWRFHPNFKLPDDDVMFDGNFSCKRLSLIQRNLYDITDKLNTKCKNTPMCNDEVDVCKPYIDTIKVRDDTIKEKDDTIKVRDDTIKVRDDTIKEKDDTIKEKDDTIKEKDIAIEAKDVIILRHNNVVEIFKDTITDLNNNVTILSTTIKELRVTIANLTATNTIIRDRMYELENTIAIDKTWDIIFTTIATTTFFVAGYVPSEAGFYVSVIAGSIGALYLLYIFIKR